MLSALRNKKVAKRILIGLAILIIPAFVFLGVGNLGKKNIGGVNYIGIIGGKKVGIDDFYKARRGTELGLILNYFAQKDVLDKILKDRPLLNRLTWDRIIMSRQAQEKKIKVSDKEVIAAITTHPLFMNNGVFDKKFYDYMLAKNLGISARIFEEEMRESLKITRLRDKILKEVSVSDEEAFQAYDIENEKAKMSYIKIDREEFKKAAEINDSEIEDYYKKFKQEFLEPERVNVQYYAFPYKNFDERDYLIEKLTVLKKESAKDSQKFFSFADQAGKTIDETGFFPKGKETDLFGLNNNVYKDLAASKSGSVHIVFDESREGSGYVIRVKEKIPEGYKPLSEAYSEIRDRLISERIEQLAKKHAEEILKSLESREMSMEEASSKLGLPIDKTDLISRFDYVQGAGEAYEILDSLLKDKVGAEGAFKTRKGYIIARLDEIKKPDKALFEKEKDLYKNKVLAAKKAKVFQDWLSGVSTNTRLVIDLDML